MQVKTFDKSIKKFIKLLGKPAGPKLVRTIELLEKFNYKLGMPHSKKISKHLFELRTYGQQNIRIVYAFHKNKIILLHGFIKKAQKIPQKELKAATQKLKSLTSK